MIQKISVTAHSGYRAEEEPKALIIGDEEIQVQEIVRRWLEEDYKTKQRKRFFVVKGSDAAIYRIYGDEETCEWFLIK